MKTVKKRTVSIIHELIGNEELMTLSELAEKFEVSQRTIRNDLKLINELLIYIHTSFHRRNVSKLQPLF